MRSCSGITLVGLLVGCVSAAPAMPLKVADAPISFARLDAKSVIKVHFESQGCFHHIIEHFVFTNPMSPQVQIEQKDKPHRTGHLFGRHLAQLDNLLKFYRGSRQDIHSTTVDTIDVVLLHNGVIVKREHYTDDSGEPENYKWLRTLIDWNKRIPAEERRLLANMITFSEIENIVEREAKTTRTGATSAVQARRNEHVR